MNRQFCCHGRSYGLRALRILLFTQLLFSAQIYGAQENDELTSKTSKEQDENVFYQDNAVRNRRNLWINKTIPYELELNRITVTMNKSIHAAIAEYQAKTCIRFVKHTTERNWIKFTTSSYCYTRIGRQFRAGHQNIYLSHICDDKRAVLHELMHTLGFYHEMSRPDRDLYVEILWENIAKGNYRSFRKVSDKYVDKLGVMYDYNSLVHYHNWAFSKNGKVTVRSRKDPKRTVGHANTFSKLDLIKINALYDCKGKLGGWSSWSGFSRCDTNCRKYRQRFCYSENRRKDCPLADQHGIETEVVKCSRKECYAPVNGQWSKWSEWSVCSTSCGYGNKTRKRKCDDPVPKHGGKKCVGESLQSTSCLMESRGPVYYRFMVYSIKHKECLSTRGNQITLEFCNKNVTRQKWAWSAYDQLVSISTGLCLDLNNGRKEDSLLLLSRCCKEKPSQQWSCNRTMVKPNNTDVYISYRKKRKLVQLRSGQGQSSQWKVFGPNVTNLCSQKPDCTTKTQRKGCCEFPFTYRGVVYKSCAISRTSGRKWCATSRNYSHDRKWGYCQIKKTKACIVKTTKGECCVFPFKYQHKLYHSCTTVNYRNRRWCATTSDFDKDRKWGRC